jgi:hypothetical protein
LRRNDINDLFTLGDMCARRSLTEEDRLLVFYVGKTLIAYQRAGEIAKKNVDRELARSTTRHFIAWVINAAQTSTRRNVAVAFRASPNMTALSIPKMEVIDLLAAYGGNKPQLFACLLLNPSQRKKI